MIQVDDRQQTAGNDHLLRITKALGKLGVPVLTRRLAFGDVAFDINGPEDCPTPLGIEIKRISDLLQCITSKRFVGYQLPGLCRTYKVRYLIVEGPYRAGNDGLIEVPYNGGWALHPSRMKYVDVLEWLTGMELKAGVHVIPNSPSTADTAYMIFSKYLYGSKRWEDHNSFNVFYEPEELASGVTFAPVVRRQRFAALLPGLGWEKAKGAMSVFPSIRAMALGDPHAPPMTDEEYQRALKWWSTVEYGKRRKMRVSEKTAREIVKAVCE